MLKRITFGLVMIAVCAIFVHAQGVDRDDNQSWNDLQVTIAANENFDFYSALTMRFGKNISRLQDGRFAIGFIWKPTKSISIQPFFWYIRMRNSSGRFRTENRFVLRASYRFPIKSFGLTHRSQFEYRDRQAPTQNSWRYRPSLTFDKDLPKDWIPKAKFYVTEEVFYDSALDKWSRNRFTVGITKTLNKKTSVDIYYMRQNDGFSIPGDLNVIGTSWKIKL